MALTNPRSNVRYGEVLAEYATLKIDNSTITYSATAAKGSSVAGRAVKVSADDVVALAADGDPIDGVLEHVEADNFASVQLFGFATVPGGNSATLTIGAKVVGAADAGSVVGCVKAIPETVTASPTQAEVQNAFKAARTRARIYNNDDTAAVVIFLG